MSKSDLKILLPEHLIDKVCVVMGTRPGIIKMSPIVRELDKQQIENFIIHTGQHYSYSMDKKFFEDLEIKQPKARVEIPSESRTHAGQTAAMMSGVEKVLLEERPKVVLVCGDANTNLAAGLAARKLRLIVGHVESGLRSHDWSMPEEHNRVMLDHICELLFAPTEATHQNLIEDNVRGEIHLVGNTIVDSVYQHLEIAKRKSNILETLNTSPFQYCVCTIHREENVDIQERLIHILKGVHEAGKTLNLPIYLPIHPRTKLRLEQFGLDFISESDYLNFIDPLGYLDFLYLLAHASLVLTDSGGIQEESCILKVPCVTLRDNTERPETIEVGANMLAGIDEKNICRAAVQMIDKTKDWQNPLGDGKTSEQIVNIVYRAMTEGVNLANISQQRRYRIKHNEIKFIS